jgi:hypothetical protein
MFCCVFFNRRGSLFVLMFVLQGYYSVHGRDALNIAAWFYKTTACVKQLGGGSQTLASVVISQTMFANILRDLLFSRNCKVCGLPLCCICERRTLTLMW